MSPQAWQPGRLLALLCLPGMPAQTALRRSSMWSQTQRPHRHGQRSNGTSSGQNAPPATQQQSRLNSVEYGKQLKTGAAQGSTAIAAAKSLFSLLSCSRWFTAAPPGLPVPAALVASAATLAVDMEQRHSRHNTTSLVQCVAPKDTLAAGCLISCHSTN